MTHYKKRQNGFSLIEIMVVVAIMAIIAGIAWSAYRGQSITGTRSEAVRATARMQGELRDFFSDNLSFVGYAASPAIVNSLTHYNIGLNLTASTYIITLTPTGTQLDDTDCGSLTLDNIGRKGYTGTAPTESRCWGSTN